MDLTRRTFRILLLVGAAALSLPPSGFTQERVGVVTNLEGTATVARVTLPEVQPLRFKDDVYLRDRITTGERSVVRVLLGGKATVTARERSVLTITEVPGVSTIELGAGRISVAVSKGLMRPGEVVEIKTPNAVSAIRGTVVVAEVFPGASVRSTITVLRGLIDVTQLDPTTRHRVGLPVDVRPLQSITVLGSLPLSAPRAITADQAKRLTSEFRVVPSRAPVAGSMPAVKEAVRQALVDVPLLEPAGRHEGESGGAAGNRKSRGDGVGGEADRLDYETSGLQSTSGGAGQSLVVRPTVLVPPVDVLGGGPRSSQKTDRK